MQAGETAHLGKGLPHKHEGRSSNPHHLCKKLDEMDRTYNPSVVRQEAETIPQELDVQPAWPTGGTLGGPFSNKR